MTVRALCAIAVAALSLFFALSTGSLVFMMIAIFMVVIIVLCFISALTAFSTLKVSLQAEDAKVLRGEEASLFIDARAFRPLPIAPAIFNITSPEEDMPYSCAVDIPATRFGRLCEQYYCPHVGTFAVGIDSVTIQDALSLFSLTKKLDLKSTLVVLPRVSEANPLPFSPGDDDSEQLSRARDDATSPADVRAYQQGDELRRVHWKLSLRKQQLMVRTFEVPARPDALLLLDCSPPDGTSYTSLAIRDALCEAAASLASCQLDNGHNVRMPLNGETYLEGVGSSANDLPAIQRVLALCDFGGDPAFERVLMLETRRLRRTGATAIFTSRLSPIIVDVIEQIRRMGPCVRVIFVYVQDPTDDETLLLHRLESLGIEVETIALVTQSEPEEAN